MTNKVKEKSGKEIWMLARQGCHSGFSPHFISALARQGRQISEFEATLVYRECSRLAKATQRNPVYKEQENQTKLKKERERRKEGEKRRKEARKERK